MKRFGLLVFGALMVVDCGGGGGGGGGTGPTPSTIAVSTGNDQVGAAGAALPESLAVIVRDQGGAPLAGVNITFTITAGGGSVSPGSRVTGSSGIAKTQRTLGPNAGTQTVNATAGSLAPAQFSAVSQINGAVNIANGTAGPLTDSVGAIKAESLVVLVTDQNAVPVQGVTVTWSSAGGSVSPLSRATSAAGLSKAQFTYGTAAVSQTATATVTGLVGSPVVSTLNATAGNAVSIAKTAGDGVTAAPSTQVVHTVQGRDTHGNPKAGVTIDWAVPTGSGSITPAQNTTAGTNGSASATHTLGTATGPQTATATAGALAGAPQVTFTTNVAVTTTVQVANNSFTPNAITIPVGTVVTWEWQGITAAHNVTFGAGGPGSIPDRTSGSAQLTFNTPGTFNYACTNHPPNMVGTVTVNP
jgi:plastocyanin